MKLRSTATALSVAALTFIFASTAEAQTAEPTEPNHVPVWAMPGGAVAGGPLVTLPRGAIINLRDLHGGVIDDPNLDVGAGGDGTNAPRGNVAINWDVGKKFLIYDGVKHLMASFGPHGSALYAPNGNVAFRVGWFGTRMYDPTGKLMISIVKGRIIMHVRPTIAKKR